MFVSLVEIKGVAGVSALQHNFLSVESDADVQHVVERCVERLRQARYAEFERSAALSAFEDASREYVFLKARARFSCSESFSELIG